MSNQKSKDPEIQYDVIPVTGLSFPKGNTNIERISRTVDKMLVQISAQMQKTSSETTPKTFCVKLIITKHNIHEEDFLDVLYRIIKTLEDSEYDCKYFKPSEDGDILATVFCRMPKSAYDKNTRIDAKIAEMQKFLRGHKCDESGETKA